MNVDGVANANPDEWPGHLAVEGPIAKRRALGEATFHLDAEEINAHSLRATLADRRRHVAWFTGDVGLDQSLRSGTRRYNELAFHAGEPVARDAAEVGEVAGFGGAECDRGAGAFTGHARRFRVLIRKHDIMFGAFAVDQRELNDLAFSSRQDG